MNAKHNRCPNRSREEWEKYTYKIFRVSKSFKWSLGSPVALSMCRWAEQCWLTFCFACIVLLCCISESISCQHSHTNYFYPRIQNLDPCFSDNVWKAQHWACLLLWQQSLGLGSQYWAFQTRPVHCLSWVSPVSVKSLPCCPTASQRWEKTNLALIKPGEMVPQLSSSENINLSLKMQG